MLSIERNNHGNPIFRSYRRPNQADFRATDARLIGTLDSKYISATNADVTSVSGDTVELVITTPNADYLPHVNLGHQLVTFYEDGRWGAEDWAQWPQWLFDGQEHFPYILRKPPSSELAKHPLRLLWWNMEAKHFTETGANLGLLLPQIAQELFDIRCNLMTEVLNCRCSDGADWQKLQAAAAGMRSCTAALRFTPQSFLDVLLTLSAAQRYCLTTRALLDKLTIWDRIPVLDDIRPISNEILGCVTDRLPILHELYEKGVPIWFVRPITQLPIDIAIGDHVSVVRPQDAGIMMKRWRGAPSFYTGPLARGIHSAIENWKPGRLDIRLLTGELPEEEEIAGKSEMATKRPQPYSKTQALEKVSSKRKDISINHSLFKGPVSPLSSKPLEVWSEALGAVIIDAKRIVNHDNLNLFRGYPFPPSHLFCGMNEKIALDAVLGWLVIRTPWMEKLARDQGARLPTPQQWRNFLRDVALGLELTSAANSASTPSSTSSAFNCPLASTASQSSSSTPTPAKLSRTAKSRESAKHIFTVHVPSKKALQHIIWHDRTIWTRHMIDFPALNRSLAIWDSQEHNFRLELVTLDRCILPAVWEGTESSATRNQKLSVLWPNNFILMEEIPSEHIGIAAPDWKVRRHFVDALCDILRDWPRAPTQLSTLIFRKNIDGEDFWDQQVMHRAECIATKFYCQTFFDYFGRAPSVPHVLPIA